MDRATSPHKKRAIEHLALWRRFRRRPSDVAVRNQLVELHLDLVHKIASRLYARVPRSIDYDTLASAGCEGLIEAISAFDPDRGIKFASFAQLRIRGAMLDELREADHAPRLARLKEATRVRAARKLAQELGRRPNEEEVFHATRIDRRELPAVLQSIDRALFEYEEGKHVRLEYQLADRRQAEPAQRERALQLRRTILRGCSRRERLMLLMYYVEDATMKEIAAQLGISESRVSQAHTELLARLRTRLEA